MVTRKPRTTVPDDWLRTADVARRFNVNVRTVYRWHCQGLLVGVASQNARLRFDPAKVEAFDRAAHCKPRGHVGERDGRITTTEAARLLGRSEFFVRSRANAGEIPCTRTRTGVRLFDPGKVEAFRTELEQLEQLEQQDAALISFSEAARRLGYTGAAHVTRLVQRGEIKINVDERGKRRINVAEVLRLIEESKGKVKRRGKRNGKGA
ncbi:helix-turn-helix domain-containing protein [Burkholderia vietnamiensis]|uniref:helix-turn-helix domain-containing protein n=1 Tax=Burkholderia vietnamiensis TaxID=60552 RepID=UPI001CF290B8|nr:helix-turn-helix domain-containing protein [Burkholderia vietnamiensis]MCA8448969.1 helix-turn-helix domain-containing protein [Burkholderia vietnamiensis]